MELEDKLIPQYFVMDPLIHDAVSGYELTDGMIVLHQNPDVRFDPVAQVLNDISRARITNRWCGVSNVRRTNAEQSVVFFKATYSDGTSCIRDARVWEGWICRKDSSNSAVAETTTVAPQDPHYNTIKDLVLSAMVDMHFVRSDDASAKMSRIVELFTYKANSKAWPDSLIDATDVDRHRRIRNIMVNLVQRSLSAHRSGLLQESIDEISQMVRGARNELYDESDLFVAKKLVGQLLDDAVKEISSYGSRIAMDSSPDIILSATDSIFKLFGVKLPEVQTKVRNVFND